ncbi:MAG TPA: OmpA family protein [Terriglobales bacterium]|nr:OmpA family protein [Terriglobales bacterium]
MTRNAVVFATVLGLAASVGCSTKKYVKQQTTPIIEKTNELDDLTAKNTNAIKDVDARAQQGITDVNQRAAAADQKAQAAGQQAGQAQELATQASNRVTSLQNTVANLDNYHPVAETTVHFAFNQANLTKKAEEALDQLASEIPNAPHYIITVEGGADSVGDRDYNYDLSQRRASAVIQYLAGKANVPAHKIYLIGLGEDKPVADNKSSAGRAQNRRVDVRLMTNTGEQTSQPAQQPGGGAR